MADRDSGRKLTYTRADDEQQRRDAEREQEMAEQAYRPPTNTARGGIGMPGRVRDMANFNERLLSRHSRSWVNVTARLLFVVLPISWVVFVIGYLLYRHFVR